MRCAPGFKIEVLISQAARMIPDRMHLYYYRAPPENIGNHTGLRPSA
jgi:hypothetical protein